MNIIPFQSRPFLIGDGVTASGVLKGSGNQALAHAKVAAIHRTDWQGRQLLYPTARTNSVLYSTAPLTDWALNGGTSSAATSVLGASYTAARFTGSGVFSDAVPALGAITGGQKVTLSAYLENVSEVSSQISVYDSTVSNWVGVGQLDWSTLTASVFSGYDAGAVTSVEPLGTGPNGGQLVKMILTCTPTLGDSLLSIIYPDARVNTNNSLIYHACQLETGAVATTLIPTANAPVTVTDYTISGTTVNLAQAPASQALCTWDGVGF